MHNLKYVLVSSVLLLLLVGGASAVTFVINDGNAALSLAATPNQEVAFSLVAAKEPDSYSATMTADDSSGAAATQVSSAGNADFVFSASAAISPEGDSAYTFSELWRGSTDTTHEASAGQGSTASVSQQTTSIGITGASVSASTEYDANTAPGCPCGLCCSRCCNYPESTGNTASESVGFLGGALNAELSADTKNSASATLSGGAVSVAANTLGIARSAEGDRSCARAVIVDTGSMTFDDAAISTDTTTTASQDVMLAGHFGAVYTTSIDEDSDKAFQLAGFHEGILLMQQTTDTLASANAVQEGDFIGAGAVTIGYALTAGWDISNTQAGVLAGKMSFDNAATAKDTATTASQDVALAGLLGSAESGSDDTTGNATSAGSGIAVGILEVFQSADTSASAHATQTGAMVAGLGSTRGEATYTLEKSWTSSNVVTGTMAFETDAYAAASTSADQTLALAIGNKGSAEAGSTDATHYATVGSGFNDGAIIAMYQMADTAASAGASQAGAVSSSGTVLGDVWTRSEAGDTSGRLVYIEEMARRKTPGTVTLAIISDASADTAIADTSAYILRTPVSGAHAEGTTTAYALSGGVSDTDSSASSLVIGSAWATDIARDANV